jgi:deoxyribodipyrimidine photolyase-like uncharacterized protein
VTVTEPNSPAADRLVRRLDVEIVPSNQFLLHRHDFARWADGRTRVRLENFYRHQRRQLGYLMDGDEPAGGQWNFDHDNRMPPPADGRSWPLPTRRRLDELDRTVLEILPSDLPGQNPVGWWAASRRGALARLRRFVDEALPGFGQFVWGIYWLWPEQKDANIFRHDRELPPAFLGTAATDMHCLRVTLDSLETRGWTHHIQRLMVLANFANLYGLDPAELFAGCGNGSSTPPTGSWPQRHGNGHVGRRRPDGYQAVCFGWRLPQPDERLLPFVPVPALIAQRR